MSKDIHPELLPNIKRSAAAIWVVMGIGIVVALLSLYTWHNKHGMPGLLNFLTGLPSNRMLIPALVLLGAPVGYFWLQVYSKKNVVAILRKATRLLAEGELRTVEIKLWRIMEPGNKYLTWFAGIRDLSAEPDTPYQRFRVITKPLQIAEETYSDTAQVVEDPSDTTLWVAQTNKGVFLLRREDVEQPTHGFERLAPAPRKVPLTAQVVALTGYGTQFFMSAMFFFCVTGSFSIVQRYLPPAFLFQQNAIEVKGNITRTERGFGQDIKFNYEYADHEGHMHRKVAIRNGLSKEETAGIATRPVSVQYLYHRPSVARLTEVSAKPMTSDEWVMVPLLLLMSPLFLGLCIWAYRDSLRTLNMLRYGRFAWAEIITHGSGKPIGRVEFQLRIEELDGTVSETTHFAYPIWENGRRITVLFNPSLQSGMVMLSHIIYSYLVAVKEDGTLRAHVGGIVLTIMGTGMGIALWTLLLHKL